MRCVGQHKQDILPVLFIITMARQAETDEYREAMAAFIMESLHGRDEKKKEKRRVSVIKVNFLSTS
jgi:hypothetical protein